jgi:hypothetical protein
MPLPVVNYQPKNHNVHRDPPEGLPAKPFLGICYGSRGSGKTNAVLNLIFHYDRVKFFDKIYFFSPTFRNDPKYQLLEEEGAEGERKRKHYDLHVYQTYTNEIFADVLKEIREDMEEYKRCEKLKKTYEKFKKAKRLDQLTEDEILDLYELDFQPPECRFERPPTSLLIFDDLVGNRDLYRADSKGTINSFVILHRHLLCSVLFVSQIWKNAVPRQIRNNLSLFMLFGNKSEAIKREVAEEVSSYIKPEEFMALWDKACEPPHSFFKIDLDGKKEDRFTRNFGDKIISDESKADGTT